MSTVGNWTVKRPEMDPITAIVQKNRSETLSVGDYAQYRKFCASRLLQLRRKLRIVTPKGRKFEVKKLDVLSSNDKDHYPEWREYFILSSERAWAHAMQMKSLQAAEAGGPAITGPTRAHIISRLAKAAKTASIMSSLTKQYGSEEEQIAAAGYHRSLDGAVAFESQKWEHCLAAFSDAHVIYAALGHSKDTTLYSEWVSENIEPSLRYAAYKQRLPRTLAISKIVAKFATRSADYIQAALKVYPSAISEEQAVDATSVQKSSRQDLPTQIQWRGRTVKLEDARVAQALAAVATAEKTVSEQLSSDLTTAQKAAAFETILTPSQDAVDATKTAIDELAAEGVASSDSRMQSLQITSTAVNYDLIGWRIGRNRVLCGSDDGASFQPEPPRVPKRRQAASNVKTENQTGALRGEGTGRKIARLRERVVLYDSTLQSLDSIRDLAGVAADQALLKKLVSRKGYFSALRCASIARAYALQDDNKKALALFARAWQHASVMDSFDDDEPEAKSEIPRHYLTSTQAKSVQHLIQGLVIRFRGLVEMDNLESEAIKGEQAKAAWAPPMIERMDEYPAGGADLTNLVTYPPRLRPVPVKPIFLDLAWNYIQYPEHEKEAVQQNATESAPSNNKRSGWFGFGRS